MHFICINILLKYTPLIFNRMLSPTATVLASDLGLVCQTPCWNFDIAATNLQCFSTATGIQDYNNTPIATPRVSPYFDAGINFYIKSSYLYYKCVSGACDQMMCDMGGANGEWSDSNHDSQLGGLLMTSNIDMTVVTNIRGIQCGSIGMGNYMVNDTSPYAMICTFVRYHDPVTYGTDIPIILLYVNASNRGGASTGECFIGAGVGFLMFTPNTPGIGNGGGNMVVTDLATVVKSRVQFGVVSNSSTPVVKVTQSVQINGPEVVINYMDNTRKVAQPVCIIPTTNNYDNPGAPYSLYWQVVIDASTVWGMQGGDGDVPLDHYSKNVGVQFGLFNTLSDGISGNFSYSDTTTWGSNLIKQNSYNTDTITFQTALDNTSVFSTALFQLVVNPWWTRRSPDTYFPPSAGLAASPAGFHELANNTANAIACQFAATGVPTAPYDATTYQQYTYTLKNAYTKQIVLQPNGPPPVEDPSSLWSGWTRVYYKISTDSNLDGGAITITDTVSGAISYGEPLCVCQSRRLEGNAVLGSFGIPGNPAAVVTAPNAMCFSATELYMYYHTYDAVAQKTTHVINDVNLEFVNNTGVEVDFASNGKTTAAVISAGATYAIPFNAAASAPVPFTLAGVSYALTASLTPAGIPVISFPGSAPFTAIVSPTPSAAWAYGVSLTSSAFAQLDLTEAFGDLAYLSPGSTLQLSGTTIYTESEGNKTATTAGAALNPGQAYYVNPPALSALSVTYSFSGGGTAVFTNEGAAFFMTTSDVPAFKNRLSITQAANGSRVLSINSCSLENETAAIMYVNIPTPWNTSSAVRKVLFPAGASIQVSANDLAYLQLTFT